MRSLLSVDKFESEPGHMGDAFGHVTGTVPGFTDKSKLPIHLHTGVFLIHPCDDGYAEFFTDGLTDSATGDSIPSCSKSWPGKEEVWVIGFDQLESFFSSLFRILRKVVVAANNCCHHIALITQGFLQSQP